VDKEYFVSTPMETETPVENRVRTETGSRVIRRLDPGKKKTQSIENLCDRSWFVNENATIEDVARDLEDYPTIQAVAVVDQDMKVTGIINRQSFFGLLSRPFFRDLFSRKPLKKHQEAVTSFQFDLNILSVNELLGDKLNADEINWYVLNDTYGVYKGIFSSRDMLIYMSDLSRSDLDMARNIQKKLTGEISSIHEMTFDLVASSQMSKGVGGDYYSINKYLDDRWMLSLCDVSGKGVAASLITSVMWGMASVFDFRKGVKEFVHIVNRYLYRTFEGEKFITGIFMDFNSSTGEIVICDMGHSYIYLYRNGQLKQLNTSSRNLPIGIVHKNDIVLNRLRLIPGDILFIPTDGLMEQENPDGVLYNQQQVENVFRSSSDLPLDNLFNHLMEDFNTFRKGRHLHDDVTAMMLKFFDEHEDDSL
jgi:sigma-B regulation protein RsbU (phosphoserine phosphatase)